MKTIYFIRHGESESNAGGVMVGANAQLTDAGKQQAESVAERIQHIDFDLLVSSTYPRALETARAIQECTGKLVLEFAYCHEREWPSAMHGLSRSDPAWKSMTNLILESYVAGERDFKIDNEETFTDLLLRAQKTREFLEGREETRIVVVTHGTFLRFLHAYLQLGDDLTPQLLYKLLLGHGTYNTGVTVYEFEEKPKKKYGVCWKLRTWMDVAHLAE